MNEHDESDSPIVPWKQTNKAATAVAEPVEGRELAKGNSREQNASRTQCRNDAPSALERIRDETPSRHDPRQEPGAVVPHAGIRPGGGLTPSAKGRPYRDPLSAKQILELFIHSVMLLQTQPAPPLQSQPSVPGVTNP